MDQSEFGHKLGRLADDYRESLAKKAEAEAAKAKLQEEFLYFVKTQGKKVLEQVLSETKEGLRAATAIEVSGSDTPVVENLVFSFVVETDGAAGRLNFQADSEKSEIQISSEITTRGAPQPSPKRFRSLKPSSFTPEEIRSDVSSFISMVIQESGVQLSDDSTWF
ncbi:MAG: hypothetical protein K8J08_16925 [Thermoanaerobaculia bacterium]|nr:hypothetical protein [Thermoanaerobaculia bacterium]